MRQVNQFVVLLAGIWALLTVWNVFYGHPTMTPFEDIFFRKQFLRNWFYDTGFAWVCVGIVWLVLKAFLPKDFFRDPVKEVLDEARRAGKTPKGL